MAGRTPGEERDAATAAPVDREEAARCHVVSGQYGAGRSRLVGFAEETAEHPVAKILDIGGPGTEIFVLGFLVAGGLGGDGFRPGDGRVNACRNAVKRRLYEDGV